jgi:hypothetical protein
MQVTANQVGHYQVARVLTGETFSVRVSSPGYATATATYRVDSPDNAPSGSNSPFLDFRLRRLE